MTHKDLAGDITAGKTLKIDPTHVTAPKPRSALHGELEQIRMYEMYTHCSTKGMATCETGTQRLVGRDP